MQARVAKAAASSVAALMLSWVASFEANTAYRVASVETAQVLPPPHAYERAIQLQHQGRHQESVRYFRQALVGNADVSQLHLELGEALHNAAIQTDTVFGAVRFVVSASQERLQLTNEALSEVGLAGDLVGNSDERAYALFVQGRILEMWGLYADALANYSEARRLAPHADIVREAEVRCSTRLEGL